jgi:hypothetical protein
MTPEERAKYVLEPWGVNHPAYDNLFDRIEQAIREAIAAERERCARVAEIQGKAISASDALIIATAHSIAAAIRSQREGD